MRSPMEYGYQRNNCVGGGTLTDEQIKKGSVGISEASHKLLVSIVHNQDYILEDRPFESIVEAFRFAFALGYSQGKSNDQTRRTVTVAPRQFVVTEYLELLRNEIKDKNKSLGGMISEYAEGGCDLISDAKSSQISILRLLE
jgi:hypothetical protein